MDNSTGSQPFEFTDYTQRVVVATMILITSVAGIVGNSLVILAVSLSRVLQTTSIAFIVNMSAAHLMCSLVLPWDVVALLSTGDLPRGDREWVCIVSTVVISISIGCGMYTLASLALNHLLLIARPTTTYKKVFTPKKVAVWLAFTWLISFVVILLPPLMNVGQFGFSEKYHLCGISTDAKGFKIYNFIRVVGLYPIPLVCIVVCYSRIWRRLRRPAAYQPDTSTVGRGNIPDKNTISQTRMLNKTMPFVVGGFLLLFLPYAVGIFIKSFEPTIPFTTAIMFSWCCVNPVVYGIRHDDFKTVFAHIIRRQWNDIPQPSPVLISALGRCKNQGKQAAGLHAE